MRVILKCVTSALSAALREITSPELVWVSSVVLVALVTDGVSATALTVIVAFTVLPPKPPSALPVEAWTLKLPLADESAVGRELQAGVALGERDERCRW